MISVIRSALVALGFLALFIAPQVSVNRLSIRKLIAEPAPEPSKKLGIVLESLGIEGASLMHKCGIIDSPDRESDEIECDVIAFKLTNKGSADVQYDVLADHPVDPFLEVQAKVDDKWTSWIPWRGRGGKIDTYSPPSWRYPAKQVVVPSGDSTFLRLHVERWRQSVAKQIRITFAVSPVIPASPENPCESIFSNAFSTADK